MATPVSTPTARKTSSKDYRFFTQLKRENDFDKKINTKKIPRLSAKRTNPNKTAIKKLGGRAQLDQMSRHTKYRLKKPNRVGPICKITSPSLKVKMDAVAQFFLERQKEENLIK